VTGWVTHHDQASGTGGLRVGGGGAKLVEPLLRLAEVVNPEVQMNLHRDRGGWPGGWLIAVNGAADHGQVADAQPGRILVGADDLATEDRLIERGQGRRFAAINDDGRHPS
jgi:hypothetical protein